MAVASCLRVRRAMERMSSRGLERWSVKTGCAVRPRPSEIATPMRRSPMSRPMILARFVTGCGESVIDTVIMTWRLAGQNEAERRVPGVFGLMALSRGDFDALARFDGEVVVLDLHVGFSFKHVQELARADVVMARLGGAGRHEFFDDIQLWRADEVPGVALVRVGAAPLVVLCRGRADRLCGHIPSCNTGSERRQCDSMSA